MEFNKLVCEQVMSYIRISAKNTISEKLAAVKDFIFGRQAAFAPIAA